MEVSQKRLIRSEERTLLGVTADARARSSADQLRPCLPLATRRDLADRLGDVRSASTACIVRRPSASTTAATGLEWAMNRGSLDSSSCVKRIGILSWKEAAGTGRSYPLYRHGHNGVSFELWQPFTKSPVKSKMSGRRIRITPLQYWPSTLVVPRLRSSLPARQNRERRARVRG